MGRRVRWMLDVGSWTSGDRARVKWQQQEEQQQQQQEKGRGGPQEGRVATKGRYRTYVQLIGIGGLQRDDVQVVSGCYNNNDDGDDNKEDQVEEPGYVLWITLRATRSSCPPCLVLLCRLQRDRL